MVKSFVGDSNYDDVYKRNSVPNGDYVSYVYAYSVGSRLIFFTVLKVIIGIHW